jgi:hypothetical protein
MAEVARKEKNEIVRNVGSASTWGKRERGINLRFQRREL